MTSNELLLGLHELGLDVMVDAEFPQRLVTQHSASRGGVPFPVKDRVSYTG